MNANAEYKTMSRPHLIQRGSFKKVDLKDITGLDSLIDYDYMGSSEFEWGALPKSLTQICEKWADYVYFAIEDIRDGDGQCLYVLCHKTQKDELTEALHLLFQKDCPFRLKEHSGMYDYISCKSLYSLKTNFWWDVTGEGGPFAPPSWMCCFGTEHIGKLITAVKKVWVKKEKQKGMTPDKEFAFLDPNLPSFGPEPPTPGIRPRPSQLIIDNDYRGKLTVTTLDGRKTVIIKQNLTGVQETPTELCVTVLTRSGNIKTVLIKAEPCSQRQALYNILKEEAELYNFRRGKK